jgi:hypothetical protein
MSQFGFEFMRDTLGNSLAFDEGGYAFLASPGEGANVLRENVALQRCNHLPT